jgi:Collagen triple helix repeat (20 copies)
MKRQAIVSMCSLVLLTLMMGCVSSGAYAQGGSRTRAISTKHVSLGSITYASLNALAVGPRGPRGYTGARGALGPLGPRGYTGATGARGATGAAGAAGAAGATGPAGSGNMPIVGLLPASLGFGPAANGGVTDSTTPPSSTFDGDYTTGWAAQSLSTAPTATIPVTTANSAAIDVDLGAPPTVAPLRYIHMVHLYWGAPPLPAATSITAATIQISGSATGATWTPLNSITTSSTPATDLANYKDNFIRIPTVATFGSVLAPSAIRYLQVSVIAGVGTSTVLILPFTLNEIVVS